MARARKRAATLEFPDDRAVFEPIVEAIEAFLGHCKSESLTEATIGKYKNSLAKLTAFCHGEQIDGIAELTAEVIDRFRPAGRSSRSQHQRNWRSSAYS